MEVVEEHLEVDVDGDLDVQAMREKIAAELGVPVELVQIDLTEGRRQLAKTGVRALVDQHHHYDVTIKVVTDDADGEGDPADPLSVAAIEQRVEHLSDETISRDLGARAHKVGHATSATLSGRKQRAPPTFSFLWAHRPPAGRASRLVVFPPSFLDFYSRTPPFPGLHPSSRDFF